MTKKHIFTLIMLLTVFLLPSLFALETRISMGVQDNWIDLSWAERVSLVEGKRGYVDIVLRDGEYSPDEHTDLLLHFNSTRVTGFYTPIENEPDITHKVSRLGSGAGVFQETGDGFLLKPEIGAFFSPGVSWGDFSIEFWLYPATLDEGSGIIAWNGSRFVGENIITQKVSCSITDGAILWRFENVFLPPDQGTSLFELQGSKGLIPRQWKHHLLRYDSATGLLEYLVDDEPDAIIHSTSTGRESGLPYIPFTGDAIDNVLEIGGSLNGLIDELRISDTFVTEPHIKTFTQNVGIVSSRVFDLGYSNSVLTRIEAETATPGETGISFFYRISEDIISRHDVAGDWRPFSPGAAFPVETRGRYLQLLMELYPDGSGSVSPTLSTVNIYYEPDLPPHPPNWIDVISGNETLTLRWQAATDSDVAGYFVYYGSKPGQYFGAGSMTGQSPIDVGNTTEVTLEGMENGRLYYVAVVSYDSSDPPHQSPFSKEVAARPSHLH
jgi:hypothetical protein